MVDRRVLNFNFLLKFFKSSRLRLISKSCIDDTLSRNFQAAASVSSPLSISGSKLPNIGFCPSDFDMSLNTTSYGFRPLKTFLYIESSWFLTWVLFSLPSVSWKAISSWRYCPISPEAKRYFANPYYSLCYLSTPFENSNSKHYQDISVEE